MNAAPGASSGLVFRHAERISRVADKKSCQGNGIVGRFPQEIVGKGRNYLSRSTGRSAVLWLDRCCALFGEQRKLQDPVHASQEQEYLELGKCAERDAAEEGGKDERRRAESV